MLPHPLLLYIKGHKLAMMLSSTKSRVSSVVKVLISYIVGTQRKYGIESTRVSPGNRKAIAVEPLFGRSDAASKRQNLSSVHLLHTQWHVAPVSANSHVGMYGAMQVVVDIGVQIIMHAVL